MSPSKPGGAFPNIRLRPTSSQILGVDRVLSTLVEAIGLFAATNIDDIFVLIGFFADRTVGSRQVVIGQYLGIIALVAFSVIVSLVSLVVAPEYVGLLGLLPILIGAKKLFELRHGDDGAERVDSAAKAGLGKTLAVAAVTIANGGDNIGIYTPVFATSTPAEIGVFVGVFMVMVGGWLLFAHWLVHHPSLGSPIRRYGHRVVPFVLIAIGVMVLRDAGTISAILG
jgi:cadmium resistance protein CadD (predicted permease)